MELKTSEFSLQNDNPHKSSEVENKNIPTLISVEKTAKNTSLEFKDQLGLGPAQIESFVREHVRVVKVGNVDITIIDQEHSKYEGELDPVLEAFIKSKRTKTVVVEYFLPELQKKCCENG